MDAAIATKVDEMLARLKAADWRGREEIKGELMAFATARTDAEKTQLREHLDHAKKELILEVRWEIEEVIEAITPPPAPVEKPPEPEPEKKKGITAADLNLVYDDPRGFLLYKTKKLPERWFATQVDPRTQQPQTFELQATEIVALKQQLMGSPYWVLGSGEGR